MSKRISSIGKKVRKLTIMYKIHKRFNHTLQSKLRWCRSQRILSSKHLTYTEEQMRTIKNEVMMYEEDMRYITANIVRLSKLIKKLSRK